MDCELENLFDFHLGFFDFQNNHNGELINQYLNNLLKKADTIDHSLYIFKYLNKINFADNIFTKKRLLIKLSENTLLKIGLFYFNSNNKINNFSYYKNTIIFSYKELLKLNNNLYYRELLNNINYNILKLNYVSIQLFFSEEEKEILKYQIENNILNDRMDFIKNSNIIKFL